MNKIVPFMFDKILLLAPEKIAEQFPKSYTYDSFPDSYCGAGNGLGEKLVPDYIFGFLRPLRYFGLDYSIKVSPACYIHDKEWWDAEPTAFDFDSSNNRLHTNMESIIEAKARNAFMKARALYRPVTYLNAVNIHGKRIFWSMKAGQGHIVPIEMRKYVSEEAHELFKLRVNSGDII